MRVVISNGTYRFHLAPLAAEMDRMGCLSALFTGGYPKGFWRRFCRMAPSPGLRRLADRCEDLPDAKVYAFQRTEFAFKGAEILGGRVSQGQWERWQTEGFHLYARMARKALRSIDYDIYHYRNCFGFESAAWARSTGRVTICDHSIGHPYAVAWMRNHPIGLLPAQIPPQPLTQLEQNYLDDFADADHILVNSDFVRQSFLACGYEPTRISVAWWGVNARFLEGADLALRASADRKGRYDLLFCGGFGRRKGAHVLMETLGRLTDHPWSLTIAGAVEADVSEEWEAFRIRFEGRVQLLGYLTREDLAREMVRHAVFVFPTLMEGSARVVFEAMACGCFVITTPHAGSIVQEGEHGILAMPGDPASLSDMLTEVFRDDYDLLGIGRQNAALVRSSYRQDQYAARVRKLYDTVSSKP